MKEWIRLWIEDALTQPKPSKKTILKYCRICGQTGHNKLTCTNPKQVVGLAGHLGTSTRKALRSEDEGRILTPQLKKEARMESRGRYEDYMGRKSG